MKKNNNGQSILFDKGIAKSDPVKPGGSRAVFDIVDALSSPILTFSSLWADTIPGKLLKNVPLARMLSIWKRDESATYLECAIYIYTRTLESPMDHDWTEIYLHVTCQTMEDWFDEDRWELVNAQRRLTDWQENKLNGLRKWIYDKRRQILKQRIKIEEDNQPVTGLPTETLTNPPAAKQHTIQQASFNF